MTDAKEKCLILCLNKNRFFLVLKSIGPYVIYVTPSGVLHRKLVSKCARVNSRSLSTFIKKLSKAQIHMLSEYKNSLCDKSFFEKYLIVDAVKLVRKNKNQVNISKEQTKSPSKKVNKKKKKRKSTSAYMYAGSCSTYIVGRRDLVWSQVKKVW